MVWNKPRNVWQWTLLFSPTILALAASQTIPWWMSPHPPMHYTNGMEVQPSLARDLQEMTVTLTVIVPASVVVALFFARGAAILQRIINAIFLFLLVLFGNGFLTAIGCSVGHVARPVEKQTAPASLGAPDEGTRGQPHDHKMPAFSLTPETLLEHIHCPVRAWKDDISVRKSSRRSYWEEM